MSEKNPFVATSVRAFKSHDGTIHPTLEAAKAANAMGMCQVFVEDNFGPAIRTGRPAALVNLMFNNPANVRKIRDLCNKMLQLLPKESTTNKQA